MGKAVTGMAYTLSLRSAKSRTVPANAPIAASALQTNTLRINRDGVRRKSLSGCGVPAQVAMNLSLKSASSRRGWAMIHCSAALCFSFI